MVTCVCRPLSWRNISFFFNKIHSQHGPYSDELLYLDVIIRPPSLCQKHDGSFTSDHYVCTEPVGEGQTCAGDMGGPLLCNGALLGLIGGHQGCAGGKAMKFVSFLYYKDWITTTIKSLSDCGFRVSISRVFLTPFLLILVNWYNYYEKIPPAQ